MLDFDNAGEDLTDFQKRHYFHLKLWIPFDTYYRADRSTYLKMKRKSTYIDMKSEFEGKPLCKKPPASSSPAKPSDRCCTTVFPVSSLQTSTSMIALSPSTPFTASFEAITKIKSSLCTRRRKGTNSKADEAWRFPGINKVYDNCLGLATDSSGERMTRRSRTKSQ